MEQPTQFHEKSGFPAWIFSTIASIPVALFLYDRFAHPLDSEPFDWIGLVILALVGLLIFSIKLTVTINNDGITYKYPPFHNKPKTIAWTEIEHATLLKISPLKEFGGWGLRYGKLGAAFTTRGRYILHINTQKKTPINLTVLDIDALLNIAQEQKWPIENNVNLTN